MTIPMSGTVLPIVQEILGLLRHQIMSQKNLTAVTRRMVTGTVRQEEPILETGAITKISVIIVYAKDPVERIEKRSMMIINMRVDIKTVD